MEAENSVNVEEVTKSDILGLELRTWERQRSADELSEFRTRRMAAIGMAEIDF